MAKQKTPKGAAAAAGASEDVADSRFSNFATDPKFRLPSKKNARTKVDKRFSRMLKDDDFTNTAKVDRYGRKIDFTGKKKALQRLYEAGDDSEDTDEDSDDLEVEDDEVVERELRRADKAYDPARGGGFSSSDDEEDEEDEEEVEAPSDEEDYPAIQAEQGEVETGEVTKRIAVVNLDWDNIKAEDLMAVFSSFLPATGKIVKVTVYPSEFGRERMEREEIEGPPKELFRKTADDESDFDDEDLDDDEEEEKIKNDLLKEDEGQEFDSAALRQYQLERLRYYYAVLECSDKQTAQHIYEATDGTEYLSSANFIDLRFIPDDVEFDEKPRDSCSSVTPGYKPTDFVTEALTHSKVTMTWDAEDPSRKDAIKKAFTGSRAELNENDLKAYLGSDSSDDEQEVEEVEVELDVPKLTKKELARQKMRAALGLTDEVDTSKPSKSKPVGDMEITFTPGLSSKEKGSVFENEPITEETTVQAYIRKEKERKARRKEKLKAMRDGVDPDKADEAVAGDEKDEAEDMGFDDPFFASDAETRAQGEKKTKTLQRDERRKKRELKEAEANAKASQRAELELLMEDNAGEVPDKLAHFDIKEIAKAEKAKKKKQRSKKSQQEDGGGKRGGLQEGFEMDVSDPRFKAVFESHEYAIDPSNPKFSATEGMKKLLDEGRRKRNKGDNFDEEAHTKSKKRKGDADAVDKTDLKSLVDKVKKKAKR